MTHQTNNEYDDFDQWFDAKLTDAFDDNDSDMVKALSETRPYLYGWQAATAHQAAKIAELEKALENKTKLVEVMDTRGGYSLLESKLAIAVEVLESIVVNVSDAWVNKVAYEALAKIKDMK